MSVYVIGYMCWIYVLEVRIKIIIIKRLLLYRFYWHSKSPHSFSILLKILFVHIFLICLIGLLFMRENLIVSNRVV